jgi:hypothetical protein
MSTLETYQHSGEFHLVPTVVGLAASTAVGAALGFVYAYGVFHIPYIIFNALLAFGFGWCLSRTNLWSLRAAKVRNTTTFVATATVASLAALYFSWATWVGIVLRQGEIDVGTLDLAKEPFILAGTVQAINEVGVWTLFDNDVKGIPLALIWLLEAAIVVGVGVLLARADFLDIPFCERCEAWCKKTKNVARLFHPDPDAVVSAVRFKNFAVLEGLGRPSLTADEGTWFQFDLDQCPKCTQMSTADLLLVVAKKNRKGQVDRTETKLIENLRLNNQEVAAIRALAKPATA